MKKLYDIILQGKEELWIISTLQEPSDFPTYQEEGLPLMRFPFSTWRDDLKLMFFPKGKLYSIELEGKERTFSFLVHLTPEALKKMADDGVDSFSEVANVIPWWVMDYKLVRPWCFLQDLFNFRWKELFLNKKELL